MKKRSKFSLSNYKILSMKMGYIVPVNLTEVLPGDTLQLSSGVFMRLAPMIAPVMHPVHMTIQHFYVPTRILWENFESFITGGSDGADASVPPTVTLTPSVSSLADYLGLPLGNKITVSALPFRAYAAIYNNYFRDQDLVAEVGLSLDDGPDAETSQSLLRPSWQKDYFTTARPWPQKGPQVTIPVDYGTSDTPSVSFNSITITNPTLNFSQNVSDANSLNVKGSSKSSRIYTYPSNNNVVNSLTGSVTSDVTFNHGSANIDISSLREAMSLQRFEEHRALFGSRYEDYLRYIGVRPQDARLQMPEYLGGTSQTIQFSEVLQTGGDGPIGGLYGHGISAMRSRRVRRFVPEHGFVISLLYVRPIPVYTQGIERMWSRQTKEDYWQKEFEHIGQQEILNKEVYADGTEADDQTFGFQNRYDEYRRGVNTVAGEFRTSQDYWHMARIFANRPALNADFVTANPTDRIFQLTEQNSDQLYCMVQNNVVARRLVSKNGNPI